MTVFFAMSFLFIAQIIQPVFRPALRLVFLAEDGRPLANEPVTATFFSPPSGPQRSTVGKTDSRGQFFLFFPDRKRYWILAGTSGSVFFIDAFEPEKLSGTVKCWRGEKPSIVCVVRGDASKGALFLRLEKTRWWVRLPEPKGGYLLLFRLPKGHYELVLTPAGMMAYWEGIDPLRPPVRVSVTPGTTKTVIFTVPPMGQVVGKVCDQRGHPIHPISLALQRDGTTQLTTFSEAGGHFRFPAVPPGTYHLVILSQDYEEWEKVVRVKAFETVTVKVVLRKRATGIVKGRVLGQDGRPPAGGTIYVVQLSRDRERLVKIWRWGKDGRFEREIGVGQYRLIIRAGVRRLTKTITVREGRTTEVGDLLLPPPAILEGVVKGDGSWKDFSVEIIAGSEDFRRREWGRIIVRAKVDETGRFQIPVPPETLWVLLRPGGIGRPLIKRVKAQPGLRVRVTFELPPFCAIEGQVVRADTGRPVPNARVFLLDETGTVVGQTRSNPIGFYAFPALLPGRYHLRCQAAGLAMGFRQDVSVGPRERVPVDFVLTPGAKLVGTVRAKKTPVHRLYVLVDARTEWAANVGWDGRFEINHLPPGPHIVMLFLLGRQIAAKEIFVQGQEVVTVTFTLP